MKIDLQELKRLAGPGRIGEAIHVETRSLKALVDVVEKAVRMAKAADRIQDDESFEAGTEFYEADNAFRAALTPFTEYTNEEA